MVQRLVVGSVLAAMMAGATGGASAQEILSPTNEELVADPKGFDSKPVSAGPCSLFTGTLNEFITCRLLDAKGGDVKTAKGLLVYLYVKRDGLDPASRELIAARCDKHGLCDTPMRVTGLLTVKGIFNLMEFWQATVEPAAQ